MHSTALSDDERKGRLANQTTPHGPPIEPITVTIATAKTISGLSNTTVYKLIGEGRLEVIKIGSRTLVVFKSLKKLLQPATAE